MTDLINDPVIAPIAQLEADLTDAANKATIKAITDQEFQEMFDRVLASTLKNKDAIRRVAVLAVLTKLRDAYANPDKYPLFRDSNHTCADLEAMLIPPVQLVKPRVWEFWKK